MCYKNRKVFIKKMTLISCVFCMLFFSSCGVDKKVKVEAEKILKAIENQDMVEVEKILLGTEDFVADEELSSFFQSSESENNGIIAKVVERVTIKIEKITTGYILYEIVAPNLSNMFQAAMKEEGLNADNFEKFIFNYIAAADTIKTKVEVSYTYEGDEVKIDYSTEAFMNALTGNMISAYQELIQLMIQENSGEM